MAKSLTEYTGFKWAGISTYPEGSSDHQRALAFLESIHWEALCEFSSTMGRNGTRWVARLRIADEKHISCSEGVPNDDIMEREIDCLQLVKDLTTVPVPRVLGYMTRDYTMIGAPVMLMNCLPGNVGVNLNFDFVPSQYKISFFEEMARIQTEMSSLLFPKIGSIKRLEDGSYEISPLPELGGPFETATEYLEAWARTTKFPHSMSSIKRFCGELYEEIAKSVSDFPDKMAELAERLVKWDRGPFPLCHVDFGHNNVVVTDDYSILGVIDWEHAFAAPWETVGFRLTLQMIPAAMDAPWNYDEQGQPKDERDRVKLEDRRKYVAAVRRAEERGNFSSSMLSEVLANTTVQDVATAVRLFCVSEKMGRYSKVLDSQFTEA